VSELDYGWSDQVPESSDYLNPVMLRLARDSGAKTVIDAGCGNGVLANLLQRNGFRVRGFDADAGGIAIAAKKYPDVEFTVGTFEQRSGNLVDLVVSTEVVEHLYSPHDLGSFCFAALRPGGRLIISTPYHGYLKNMALSLVNKWDTHHLPNWHGGHIKFWSRKTLTQMLEKAGFQITGFVGVGRVPYLWKSMILIAQKPE
jgi:2-polyprenyl-3-methyl-5-hydroxy-6-metoxy-1,4-benzoquinol methylase